jgi:thiaminase
MASCSYKMASNQMMSSVLHLIQLVSDDNDDSHIYVIPLYGPSELEIKDTTDTDKSASYLDLFLEITTDSRLYKPKSMTNEMTLIFQ